jgi:hypothetical protein
VHQINNIPNVREVFLDLFFCNFCDDVSIKNFDFPLLKLDRHHRAYELVLDIDNINFNDTFDTALRYNFLKADYSSILNYLHRKKYISCSGKMEDS